jgi:hypothetical protein
MDQSTTPEQTVRLLLEIDRTPDGRLKGRACADGTDTWEPFCGVLELLKVLEDYAATSTAAHARNTHSEKELS